MEKRKNNGKIILDLCGGTGAWSKPYADAGYDVRVVTLPAHDVTRTIFFAEGLVFPICSGVKEVKSHNIRYKDVYGVLAAPPCTMFSIARKTTAKQPRDFQGAMEIVKSCMEIIWKCQGNGEQTNLTFWALENPRGYLRQFLGMPTYSFHQWEYGELLSKTTDIWGYFQKPTPTIKQKPDADIDAIWGNPKPPKEYEGMGLKRQDVRAITPAGFAKAFYKSNP